MRTREETHAIREFIVENIDDHPADVARLTAEQFNLSRQSVMHHINRLITDGVVDATGRTRARLYTLHADTWIHSLAVGPDLEEDVVWRELVAPRLGGLTDNVELICNHGFTEMLNNVKDHSESSECQIGIRRDAIKTTISVHDSGIGIFEKIQRTFALHDPRHALLELAKGKLTTDSKRHTGEGVFFTSRMFDQFKIMSGTLYYTRTNKRADEWLIDVGDWPPIQGTTITMVIRHDATQTTKQIFDLYASEANDYGFTRTHVPLQLAMYEGEHMLSRSQAKRILARVDRFREVLLDYTGVMQIGQAFADEIYRVFAIEHPHVNIVSLFTTPAIDDMIARAKAESNGQTTESAQLSLLSLDAAQD